MKWCSVNYRDVLDQSFTEHHLNLCFIFTALRDLDPFKMKKSFLGEEGYPLRRVNFRERLYEKNVIPLPQLRADNNLAHCLAQSR